MDDGTKNWKLVQGDCVEQMRLLQENSVDSVVCDPPYGLEFMGKEWDKLRVSDNPSGPQSAGWHDNGGKNPYARRATPRYAGKKLGATTSPRSSRKRPATQMPREATTPVTGERSG
jgi:DNA modification methylase